METLFALFHEAMRALLGSQDMVGGLSNLFGVLRRHMPLEALTYDAYDDVQRALVIEHLVTNKGFFSIHLRVPLSPAAAEYVENNREKQMVLHLEHERYLKLIPSEHMLALESHVPFCRRDYMAGILHMDSRFMGALVCISKKNAVFGPDHARLLESLLPACAMSICNVFRLEDMSERHARMVKEQGNLRRELAVLTEGGMVGAQSGLREVLESVRRLACTDTPVLILGETGTGKELVANAIQQLSSRAEKAFVKVNCGALSDSLLDSELFGHEKGAFTGATRQRQGRFEQANGGTLFLDEVGELTPQAQVRLLRVLQDGLVERIGSERAIEVDVRILTATNRDLAAMCREGRFREDLFHRLNVFPLHIPPLRERREDIPLLVSHLAGQIASRLGMVKPEIRMDHLDRLMQYPWPGNVRELENLVERGLILAQGAALDLARLLPLEGTSLSTDHGANLCVSASGSAFPATSDPEEARIREALCRCNGKVYGPNGAAALLGMNHNTLYSRLRKLGVRTSLVWGG